MIKPSIVQCTAGLPPTGGMGIPFFPVNLGRPVTRREELLSSPQGQRMQYNLCPVPLGRSLLEPSYLREPGGHMEKPHVGVQSTAFTGHHIQYQQMCE